MSDIVEVCSIFWKSCLSFSMMGLLPYVRRFGGYLEEAETLKQRLEEGGTKDGRRAEVASLPQAGDQPGWARQ